MHSFLPYCIILNVISLKIGKNEENQRLDRFLKKYLASAPLSMIYKIIRKDIKVNGARKNESYILQLGDELSVYLSEEDLERYSAKKKRGVAKRQFKIVYEDSNLLIVDKPYGLLTHGDATERKNHLANQVLDYLIEEGAYDPRNERTFSVAPANRLDRNTTGLVVFGKTAEASRELNRIIRERDAIEKYYLTIANGELKKPLHLEGTMVKDEGKNLVKVLDSRKSSANVKSSQPGGKSMVTDVEPLTFAKGYSLLQVKILTGRTHQIRAQLAKAGYPLIGDVKYGTATLNRKSKEQFGLNTQLLHAWKLRFLEVDGILGYLKDKEFCVEPSENFERIKKIIFGEFLL